MTIDEVCFTYPHCVAEVIQLNQRIVLLDSRSFVEYNTSHIFSAINVGGNRAFQRKFSLNNVPMDKLLLKLIGSTDLSSLQSVPIIVYDNCLDDMNNLNPDCFLYGLLVQLLRFFYPVFLLKGGFLGFQAHFPELCWTNEKRLAGEDVAEYDQADCELERVLDLCLLEAPGSSSSSRATRRVECCGTASGRLSRVEPGPMKSASGPSIIGEGIDTSHSDSAIRTHVHPDAPPCPSPVLPHLVLGSQADALSTSVTDRYGITHVLNVSVDGPAPDHIQPDRFMRIPVQDSYNAVILPYLKDACKFIDQAKASNGCVLVHCAAGISRSPTVAIAYLMYTNGMSMREAYNLVKSKRTNIAPNFNFLGQLLDLDRQLFPSNSPGQSSSGSSTPVQRQQQQVPQLHLSNQEASSSTSTRRPSMQLAPLSSTSPKHSVTKKRERPTYLSLDPYTSTTSLFARPMAGQRSYQPSPTGAQSVTPEVASLNEGKRSRVSLLNPFPLVGGGCGGTLLPSPCTGLSSLQLSSPSEDRRRLSLLMSPQPLPSHTPTHQTDPPSAKAFAPELVSALTNLSSTSMDKLHYEPCSVGGDQPFSPMGGGLLRRSLTSLATAASGGGATGVVRPTLLAERRVSCQQQSAPPTPNRFPTDWGRQQILHLSTQPGGRFELSSPESTATSCSSHTVSVPFTRDFSPLTERFPEPSIEYDQLQQCCCVPRSCETLDVDPSLSRESQQRSYPDSRSSSSHDCPPVPPSLLYHRLSHSAPSCSTIAVQLTEPALWPENPVRTKPTPSSSSCRVAHMWTTALGLELSCRQEQTLWHSALTRDPPSLPAQAGPNRSSGISQSAGNLSTLTGSYLTLFPVT